MTAQHALPDLKALAAFLPEFDAPGFQFAHNDSPLRQTGEKQFEIVGYQYDPLVWKFWEVLDNHGWLITFNWMEWTETAEAQHLRSSPTAITQASSEELSKLLSMYARMERFSEGAWLSFWDSGLLMGILRRANALAEAAKGTND